MKSFFSLEKLIMVAIIFIASVTVYLFFLILPYLEPVWSIIHTVSIPFILSMIIAYLLHPLVDVLMKFGLRRGLAILFIYLFFIGGISLAVWGGTPLIVHQVKDLIEQLPNMQEKMQGVVYTIQHHLERLPDGVHQGIDDTYLNLEYKLREMIAGVVNSVGRIIGNLFTLLVVPFLVFYLLLDVEVIQKTVYFFVPRNKRKPAIKLWKDIDASLAEYIRGQITISLIVGVFSFIGYYFIGLPYAFLLAIFVAITNIIPYFGPYIGAAPAVLVALFTEPSLVLWIILLNTIIQIVEGNILAPYIVGRRLHIHPIFIIFALLIGEEMGGVLGMILAVPIFVVLKVIILNTVLHVRQYKIDRA